MNRAYIIIDCWDTTRTDIVGNIIRTINQNANDIVINANYNYSNKMHPMLAKALTHRPYYQLKDNIELLASLLVKHRSEQVCIMGGSWPACTHHSAFGLYALEQLKATIPFEIIIYPQCLSSYETNKPISGDELNGWYVHDDYYRLLKTTPPLA